MLTSAKTKWDLFCEQKSIVIWKQQSTKSSTKDVNLGTITDTLSWYQFSPLIGIRVKPKLHRRWRTIYESLQKPSQKPKFMHTNNLSEFGQYCEELSWNHWTSTLHRSETSRIAGRAVRRAKEETSAVLLQSGSDDKWSDSKAWLLLSARCCRPNDTREIKKMNKDLGNPSRTCFVRGRNWGRRSSDCWDWRNETMDASEIFTWRLNAKEVLITPQDGQFVFPYGRWFSKIIRKRLRIPRTHSETEIHRKERERISAENLTAIGKSFDLKNKKMTQKLGNNFGLFEEDFIFVIRLNRGFNLRAQRKESFLISKIYIIERNSSEKKYTMRLEDWSKTKTSEANTNSIVLILQGRTEFCTCIITLRKNSFRWKDPEEALHLIPFECESKHTLSRLAAQRTCETKFFK